MGKRLTMLALAMTALAACSDDNTSGNKDGVADLGTSDSAVDAEVDLIKPDSQLGCGTGNRLLAKGLTELKWDDGKAISHIRKQTWTINDGSKTYTIAKEALHEAVRFPLQHPAKIHGFSVQWDNIPAGLNPKTEIQAGLYRDFGNNGFDFWSKDPYWTGTRCVEDISAGKFVQYVFDKPITVSQPGLVYVAHLAQKTDQPVFAFADAATGVTKCDKFDKCHSSVNLPDAAFPTGSYYNGVTFSLQYNFMVRLYVEYTQNLKESERRFRKQTGVKANKGSVSWGDYNNDGWDDLLVGSTLYKNDKGTFTDVSASSGITALNTKAAGGVWGDYNNDGCLDLFMFAEQYNKADTLLKGDCKGSFSDVTAAAKIVDHQTYNNCGNVANTTSPTAAAAWVDLDADGNLDLYLANFICWTPGTYYKDTVFRNKGDGTFEEWTSKNGFSSLEKASRGVAPIDHDGDGDVDIFVNTYRLHPNFMFVNDGKGTVVESGTSTTTAGVATFYSGLYYYGHTIGAAWGDLDNDGDFDLISSNLAHPRFWHFSDRTQVLINDGKGKYKDNSGMYMKPYGNPTGLRYQETHSVPVLGDFNNDGNLDLAITCVYEGRPTDFYWGKGDGTFELDVYTTNITTTDGWGTAASDYDNDGDLDLMVTDFYKNDPPTKSSGHWLQVRAVGGIKANWAAIGSTVKIKAGSKTYMRHVQGGTGKGCQDSLYLHFGIGSATSVSEISVTFPGAKTVKYSGPFAADKRVWVYEDGKTHVGWGPK